MHREQKADGGGGHGQICRAGVGFTTKDVAQRADDDHAKSDEGERGAEEAHGAAGEVEEMGERKVVVAAL